MKPNQSLPLAFVLLLLSFSQAQSQQTPKITPSGIGYLEYLPEGYQSGAGKFPLVVSLHGIKEKGTSSTDPKHVLKDVPVVANVGLPKYVKFGQKYPFILISPQLKSSYGSWSPAFIMEVVNHVRKTLRIDDTRIYLTGLSLGGFGVWKTAGEYPNVFAAIAPICAGGNAMDKAVAIAKENVAVWGFHGSGDHIVSHTVTTNMINAINAAPKKPNPLAKVTIFPGMGHIIWDKAYLETNVIDWMLSFRKGSAPPSQSANSHPVVKAGEDRTVTLPASSALIEGKASDEDGQITAYSWTKVSGPDATLSGTSTAQLKVEQLQAGVYVFRLTAKDNDGASASDDVQLTVKASANKAPVVNAGPDRTLTLPLDKLSLEGTASDPDGQIVSYEWSKISGGTASLGGTSSRELTVTNIVAGNYTFRLTVKDNGGTSISDEVTVTIKAAPSNQGSSNEGSSNNEESSDNGESPNNEESSGDESSGNASPVVNAGRDRTLVLPQNAAQFSASASDADGTIVSYSWTQVAGGGANISGVSSPTLSVTGLRQGTYVFRLVVRDNLGATGEDNVTVIVRDAPTENHFSGDITPTDYTGSDRSAALDSDIVEPVNIPWLVQ